MSSSSIPVTNRSGCLTWNPWAYVEFWAKINARKMATLTSMLSGTKVNEPSRPPSGQENILLTQDWWLIECINVNIHLFWFKIKSKKEIYKNKHANITQQNSLNIIITKIRSQIWEKILLCHRTSLFSNCFASVLSYPMTFLTTHSQTLSVSSKIKQGYECKARNKL